MERCHYMEKLKEKWLIYDEREILRRSSRYRSCSRPWCADPGMSPVGDSPGAGLGARSRAGHRVVPKVGPAWCRSRVPCPLHEEKWVTLKLHTNDWRQCTRMLTIIISRRRISKPRRQWQRQMEQRHRILLLLLSRKMTAGRKRVDPTTPQRTMAIQCPLPIWFVDDDTNNFRVYILVVLQLFVCSPVILLATGATGFFTTTKICMRVGDGPVLGTWSQNAR